MKVKAQVLKARKIGGDRLYAVRLRRDEPYHLVHTNNGVTGRVVDVEDLRRKGWRVWTYWDTLEV